MQNHCSLAPQMTSQSNRKLPSWQQGHPLLLHSLPSPCPFSNLSSSFIQPSSSQSPRSLQSLRCFFPPSGNLLSSPSDRHSLVVTFSFSPARFHPHVPSLTSSHSRPHPLTVLSSISRRHRPHGRRLYIKHSITQASDVSRFSVAGRDLKFVILVKGLCHNKCFFTLMKSQSFYSHHQCLKIFSMSRKQQFPPLLFTLIILSCKLAPAHSIIFWHHSTLSLVISLPSVPPFLGSSSCLPLSLPSPPSLYHSTLLPPSIAAPTSPPQAGPQIVILKGFPTRAAAAKLPEARCRLHIRKYRCGVETECIDL